MNSVLKVLEVDEDSDYGEFLSNYATYYDEVLALVEGGYTLNNLQKWADEYDYDYHKRYIDNYRITTIENEFFDLASNGDQKSAEFILKHLNKKFKKDSEGDISIKSAESALNELLVGLDGKDNK